MACSRSSRSPTSSLRYLTDQSFAFTEEISIFMMVISRSRPRPAPFARNGTSASTSSASEDPRSVAAWLALIADRQLIVVFFVAMVASSARVVRRDD